MGILPHGYEQDAIWRVANDFLDRLSYKSTQLGAFMYQPLRMIMAVYCSPCTVFLVN